MYAANVKIMNTLYMANTSGSKYLAVLSVPDNQFDGDTPYVNIAEGFDMVSMCSNTSNAVLSVGKNETGMLHCGYIAVGSTGISSSGPIQSTKSGDAFIAITTGTNEARMRVQNGSRNGIFMVSTGYNLGIYDSTNSNWMIYSNTSQTVVVPHDIECSGTLTLTRSTDAAGTTNNKPALIVGGASTAAHLELDANEIMAKGSGTTVAGLNLNTDGGAVTIGKAGQNTTVKSSVLIHNPGTGYSPAIRCTNTDTEVSIQLHANMSGTQGLYSYGYSDGENYTSSAKWLIYRDTNGNVHVNGSADSATSATSATTATKANQLTTARNITVGSKTNSFNGTAAISFSLADIGANPTIATYGNAVTSKSVTCSVAGTFYQVPDSTLTLSAGTYIIIGHCSQNYQGGALMTFAVSTAAGSVGWHECTTGYFTGSGAVYLNLCMYKTITASTTYNGYLRSSIAKTSAASVHCSIYAIKIK